MLNPQEAVGAWEGTATYKGATYRVSLIASAGSWKADLIKAVNRAGGYNVQLEKGTLSPDDVFKLSVFGSVYRVAYTITFIPDHCLTAGAGSRSQVTVTLRSDLSIVRDGEFQKVVKAFNGHPTQGQGRLSSPVRIRP